MGIYLPLHDVKKTSLDPQKKVRDVYEDYINLFHLSQGMVESKDVHDILNKFIKIIPELVDFSALGLLLKEKFTDDFYIYYDYKSDKNFSKRIRWLERSGYLSWVCQERRVVIIPGEYPDKGEPSLVVVPLLSGKIVLGVLVIFLKLNFGKITSRLSDRLYLLGTQAGIALENAYLYQEMDLKHNAMTNMKSFLEDSLESMADGLFAIDMQDKIALFNKAATQILGISSVEAVGLDYHRLFPEEFVSFLERALETTNQTGHFEGEFDFLNMADGKTYPLELQVSFLKNGQKQKIGFIINCQNIAERQEIIHLKKLDKLKDEFISAVSHELRTPLTGIKSFTEILLNYSDQDEEARREFLSIIERETNRLIEIINDLLDIGQMSQSNFQMKRSRINIREVYHEAISLLQVLASSRKITVKDSLDPDNEFVDADFKRLIQVFVNLIGNAIKFSAEGQTIEVSSKVIKGKRRMDQGDFLQIAVKDYGIGIPKEHHKAIFEKFKQFSYDSATKPEGSGLGLSICKKIVKKSGGNIWVESKENEGSTFYFTLPLSDCQEDGESDEVA